MTQLIVLYRMPKDPKHFEKYYREVHVPLSAKVHARGGIGDVKYGRVHAVDGGTSEFFWFWSGAWESRKACLDALASPEGQAGAADQANYYHEDPVFMFLGD
jgi:uncharacterized protein (TIGR02118 family)